MRELEADCALAVLRAIELGGGVAHGVEDGVYWFAGRLAVRDDDYQGRLAELVRARLLDDEWLDHFVAELGAHRRQPLELYALDHLLDFQGAADVVALEIRVHEADLDAILVEEGGGECDLGKNEL